MHFVHFRLAEENFFCLKEKLVVLLLRHQALEITSAKVQLETFASYMASIMHKKRGDLMKKNYNMISKEILENIGGAENVVNAMHCYTRLRVNLKDTGLVDIERIKESGVIGTQFAGEQLQIIVGNDVKELYEAFIQLAGLESKPSINEKIDDIDVKKKVSLKSITSSVMDGIVGSMIPILPMLIASGILKAVVLLLQQFNVVGADSPTLVTLSFVADAAFYFMPVIIGVFAAKKFGGNMSLAAMLGAALIHPTFVTMIQEGTSLSVFGLPIHSTNYTSTVVPIILSVYVMSRVEKIISKYSPKSMRALFEPVFTILIMIPLTFVILAPLGSILSTGFAEIISWFYSVFGIFAVAALCAIIPFVVMFGMHIGTVPIAISSIAASGMDKLVMPAFLISNFTQGAACLAVGLKSKQVDLKSLAFSSAFSNFVPGISEPGMYGITLRFKTPMWGAMIGAAVGGLYFGIMNVGAFAFLPPNIFGLAGYVGEGANSGNLMHTIIGILIGAVVAFIATMILYKPIDNE